MNLILITIVLVTIIYLINKFFKNQNLLSNYRGYKHQKFSGLKNVPLSGGPFLIFSLILFYFNNFNQSLFFIFVFTFCIGFISDINLLSSPKLRFVIQFIIIVFLLFY